MRKIADSIRRVGLVANPEKPRIASLVRRAVRILRGLGRELAFDSATAVLAGVKDPPATGLEAQSSVFFSRAG